MSMPWRFAVWISVSPANASTPRPFSVIAIVWSWGRALMLFSDLVREVLDDAAQGIRRGLTEPADRRVGHRDRQFFEQVAIPVVPLDHAGRLLGADPARRALAARLVGEELHHAGV